MQHLKMLRWEKDIVERESFGERVFKKGVCKIKLQSGNKDGKKYEQEETPVDNNSTGRGSLCVSFLHFESLKLHERASFDNAT